MLKIILAILAIGLFIGAIYYYRLINSFKKFILFEQQIKKNPNDALIKQYMDRYKQTFFPKREEILRSRANFYHAIKASNQVSYETKRELRQFLEAQGVNLIAINKAKQEEIEEELNED